MKNAAEKIDKQQGNGVLPCVINWLAFTDVQPTHEQPIVYWRGGYKLGKWNGETKTMWDGSPKPKVWYPLPTCL